MALRLIAPAARVRVIVGDRSGGLFQTAFTHGPRTALAGPRLITIAFGGGQGGLHPRGGHPGLQVGPATI